MKIKIQLNDLEGILNEELSGGIPSHDWNKTARHRRMTYLLVRADLKAQKKAVKRQKKADKKWRKEQKRASMGVVAHFEDHGRNKIAVIKVMRAHYGSGLKEAKQWTEGDFSLYSAAITDRQFARDLEECGADIRWVF